MNSKSFIAYNDFILFGYIRFLSVFHICYIYDVSITEAFSHGKGNEFDIAFPKLSEWVKRAVNRSSGAHLPPRYDREW